MGEINEELDAKLDELIDAGKEPDPSLLEDILAFGQEAVGPLIGVATDEDLNWADQEGPEVWAPLHAVRLLGTLRAAEAVEPLLDLLEMDDDWMRETVPLSLGKIGEPTIAPARARVLDPDQELWVRAHSADALKHVGLDHPQTRAVVVAALVKQLDQTQFETADEDMLNGVVIGHLADLKAVEVMPAIQRAFEEDRVDPSMIALDDVRRKLGLPVDAAEPDDAEGMRLLLECASCGRGRYHHVARVYADIGTIEALDSGEEPRQSPWIIPQRIIFPKCGAVDRYTFSPFAMFALIGQLERQDAGGDGPPDRTEGPLIPRRFALADGREMHPLDSVEMYRLETAAHPEDATLHLRYGNVLRLLGYRREAADEYCAAAKHDPRNPEPHLNLGTLLEEDGRWAEARPVFERVRDLVLDSTLPPQKRWLIAEYAKEALSGAHESDPDWSVENGPQVMLELPASAGRRDAQEPVRIGRKVGRNEPCPCGSGKKYKRCHGA